MTWENMNILILSGAGLSAESGIPVFRGKDGFWEDSSIEDVATPAGFDQDPSQVHSFYNSLRNKYRDVQPNSAHFALAELQQNFTGDVVMVTQNIDNLLEQAGCSDVLHMHGEILKCRCIYCHRIIEWKHNTNCSLACPICGKSGEWGSLRPHVVWFNEVPLYLQEIEEFSKQCDLFLSVGTSGVVYPAAGFVKLAKLNGARTVCVDLEPPKNGEFFGELIVGPAGETMPKLVKELYG